MKYFALILVLAVCGAFYVHNQQPQTWSSWLEALGVGGTPAVAPPSGTSNQVMVTPPPAPPVEPKRPEYINGDASSLNPDHTRPVDQPIQPQASASPAGTSAQGYVAPNPLPAQANWTWATIDGTQYHNVVIQKVDADTVVITHDGGVSTLHLITITPDLQRMLNYDPDLAVALSKQKADERAKIQSDQAP